jgi:Uncharacterized conserved protein
MIILQAITTKYLPATNRRGSRIKATAAAGNVTLGYSCALNTENNHAVAARALAEKYGWKGQWFGGGLPDGRGYTFVCVSHDPASAVAFESEGKN